MKIICLQYISLNERKRYGSCDENKEPARRNRNDAEGVLRAHRDPGEDAGGLGGRPAEAAGVYPEADRVSADV